MSSDIHQQLPEEAKNPSLPEMYPLVSVQMEDGRRALLYELQPKQKKAWAKTPLAQDPEDLEAGDYHKHIGYGGAAGGAKSHLARATAVHACLKWPGINALIIRRTKDEVKKNHIKPFWQEVPKDGLPDGTQLYDWNGQELCATFRNGSSLYFGYMKEEGDELQYQGNEFDVIVFEEATHYTFEQVRYLTGERMRATQPYSFPFALYPSNPGNQGHQWYKRLFIDGNFDPELNEDADDYAFVQSYVWDNQVLLLRDPEYIEKKLLTLPEPLRSWRLWGDWDAGEGLALTMLDKQVHIVDQFKVPSHWPMWGGFDWGYAHPWAFGLYAASEDRRVYKVFSISGRRMLPKEIARAIKSKIIEAGYGRVLRGNYYSRFDSGQLNRQGFISSGRLIIHAGHDCWNQVRARGEDTPTIAEQFNDHDLILTRANVDRIQGLNNLRHHLAWESRGPEGQDIEPYLLLMDEPGNRACFKQLSSIPSDPDRPEDALKQDADDYGHGGDDYYDETRYALASRPTPAPSEWLETDIEPWSKETIKQEAEMKRKGNLPRSMQEGRDDRPVHPEFGSAY